MHLHSRPIIVRNWFHVVDMPDWCFLQLTTWRSQINHIPGNFESSSAPVESSSVIRFSANLDSWSLYLPIMDAFAVFNTTYRFEAQGNSEEFIVGHLLLWIS